LSAAACRICGAAELRLAYEGSTGSPWVLQARVVGAELKTAYTKMVDEAYVVEEAARRATCRKLLSAASPDRSEDGPPLVLDVGCGVGLLLDEARRGSRTQGVELSDWGVRRARHLGLDVFQCDLEEAGFDPGSFDAVFMIDVLEHLADPVRTLVKVSQVLRPGGVFCLVTPDAASAAAAGEGPAFSTPRLLPHDRFDDLTGILVTLAMSTPGPRSRLSDTFRRSAIGWCVVACDVAVLAGVGGWGVAASCWWLATAKGVALVGWWVC
jgi:SAM-dependent methyltransferase